MGNSRISPLSGLNKYIAKLHGTYPVARRLLGQHVEQAGLLPEGVEPVTKPCGF